MKINEKVLFALLDKAATAEAGLLRVVSSDDGSPEQMEREEHAFFLEKKGLFEEVHRIGKGTYRITSEGRKYLHSMRK